MDVWLWRARFFRTRALAAKTVEAGAIRLTRGRATSRLDKRSRTLRPGDELVFVLGGRLTAIRIQALGQRRGTPAQARELYAALNDPAPLTSGGGA